MIQYNSADLEGYNEVERTKMAIQKKLKENYQLGKFYTDDSISISHESRIWYSYDENRYNFHIVPDETTIVQNTEETLSEWLKNRLDTIIKQIPDIITTKEKTNYKEGTFKVDNKKYLWARSEGKGCTINHKWISIIDEKNEYEYILLAYIEPEYESRGT